MPPAFIISDLGVFTDDFLLEYVNEFAATMERHDVGFEESERLRSVSCGLPANPDYVGIATFYDNGDIRIAIDCRAKEPADLRSVIYHEMGHALYGLDHSECKGEIQYYSLPPDEKRDEWALRVQVFVNFIANKGVDDECR